jgi:predicted NUDIX family NTP pyrophosphohydrolase
MYRRAGDSALQVLLAHPGGPFWARRDLGAWSVPKGECLDGEDLLACAQREFLEETGLLPAGPFAPLGEVRQSSGKQVTAWAFEGSLDPAQLQCNPFEMEWPPKSGRMQSFPEVDRVEWFGLEAAREKILAGQAPFIDRLAAALAAAD